jgi:hypothetical protein
LYDALLSTGSSVEATTDHRATVAVSLRLAASSVVLTFAAVVGPSPL